MSADENRPDVVCIGVKPAEPPCVGVFYWTFKRLFTDMLPLAQATSDGIAISHGEHLILWKKVDAVARLSVANSYSALPRGRVVYHLGTSRFSLYADRCIPQDWLKEAARQFRLPDGGYDVRRDPHYRCGRCLRNFVSDDAGNTD